MSTSRWGRAACWTPPPPTARLGCSGHSAATPHSHASAGRPPPATTPRPLPLPPDRREQVPPSEYGVSVSELKHDAKEKTVVLQDVRADPTLPRTRDVRCPQCQHQEAVFFSASSEQGMVLYFNCMGCGHRWRDYV